MSYTFPAGEYYIGDLCYVLSDRLWRKLCDMDTSLDGELQEIKGGLLLMDGTTHGDGCYFGSDGNKYPVDSGTIGICSIKLLSAKKVKDNFNYHSPVIVKFPEEFKVNTDKGWFKFGHIVIDTGE